MAAAIQRRSPDVGVKKMKKQSVLPDHLKGRRLADLVVGDKCFAHVESLVVDHEGYCYVNLYHYAYRNPRNAWNGIYLAVTRCEEYMEVDMSFASAYRWHWGTAFQHRPERILPAFLTGVRDDLD